jgi:uncharacterized protein
MQIQDVDREKCRELLAHLRLGRIACAEAAQPYIVPFYFAYQDSYLYSFSTVGQNIRWMRANPLVCVEADEIVSPEEWASIVISGRYEELPDIPDFRRERDLAYALLQRNDIWWEPGYSKTIVKGNERPLVPVYFRIRIVEMTGHHAAPDPAQEVSPKISTAEQARKHSLKGILAGLRSEPFVT